MIRLTLELDPGAEPIAGVIRNLTTGASWPFRGWLGLAVALEDVLRA